MNLWHVFWSDAVAMWTWKPRFRSQAQGLTAIPRMSGNISTACFRPATTELNCVFRQQVERQDTPGHLASRLGLAAVLLAMLEHGFKVNSKNAEKKTCLHIAIESEHAVSFPYVLILHGVFY